MGNVYLDDSILTGIANSIRAKTGESGTITPANMASEINDITTGGTIESLNILANGTYTAPSGVDGYSPIVVNVAGGIDFTNVYRDFLYYKGRFLDLLSPSDLEIPSNRSLGTGDGVFADINNPGKNIPDISITGSSNFGQWYNNGTYFFKGSGWQNIPKFKLGENVQSTGTSSGVIPKIWSFTDKYLDTLPTIVTDVAVYYYKRIQGQSCSWNSYTGPDRILFNCYVKDATDFYQRYRWIDNQTFNRSNALGYYSTLFFKNANANGINDYAYNGFFPNKYLDGVYELYVIGKDNPATTNMFQPDNNGVSYLCLAGTNGNTWKDFMFEMRNENTPFEAMWQKQYIVIGSSQPSNYAVGSTYFNTSLGIPAVQSDAEYELYKNQVYGCGGNQSSALKYSRYNHDSAVRTLKSLPDCSAYLESSGGTTNTIRFYQPTQGYGTDAGAVNTMTAEEIAVATNKGWTVMLS